MYPCMKTSERHRLKENEFAQAVGQAQVWLNERRTPILATVAAIVLAAAAFLGYRAWQDRVESQAAAILAQGMVIAEARVAPPLPPAGTTNDPTAVGGQAPGTYPTEQAKLEAALEKFKAAADSYPNTQSGQLARLQLAKTLARLHRTDEALAQYDQLVATNHPLLATSARLGKASAQLVAGQYDPAIATLKDLSEQASTRLPKDGLLMELARAYRLAGRTEDARKTLTQVVEQHAESPFASEAKTEIEKLKS
jgi:predicted negative regulator of RcsB-dependent stress response